MGGGGVAFICTCCLITAGKSYALTCGVFKYNLIV